MQECTGFASMPVENRKTRKNVIADRGRTLYDVQERLKGGRPQAAVSIVRAVIVTALIGAVLWLLILKLAMHLWTGR